MSKLNDFLKKIHVDAATLKSLQEDSEVDVDKLAKDYITERQEYFTSSLLPDKIKSEVDKTVKGMTLKAIKQVNKTFGFGFTNTQMEEFESIDDFMSEADKLHKKNLDDLTKGQKDDLIKQINTIKEQLSAKQQELDKVVSEKETEIKKVISEKDKEVRLFKAKDIFDRIVKNDKELPDLPGKDFALENIREKIFSQYDVQEDGTILTKDGTTPIHPDPERPVAVKKIEDIYPYYKSLAGLVKQNNAGEGGGGSGSGYDPGAGGDKLGESEKYLLEQLK